jgi:hypothetical protein
MTVFQVTVNTSNSRTDCQYTAAEVSERGTRIFQIHYVLNATQETPSNAVPLHAMKAKGGNEGTNDSLVGQPASHSLYRLSYRSSITHWSLPSFFI